MDVMFNDYYSAMMDDSYPLLFRQIFGLKMLMTKEDAIEMVKDILGDQQRVESIPLDFTFLINYIFRDDFSIGDLEEFIKTMKETFKSIVNIEEGKSVSLGLLVYVTFFERIMGLPKQTTAKIPDGVEYTEEYRIIEHLVNYIYDTDLDLSEVKKFAEIYEGMQNDTTIIYPDNRGEIKDTIYRIHDNILEELADNRGEIIDTQNHFTKYAVYELSIGKKVYYGYSEYTDNNQLENRVRFWLNDDKEGHVYNADVLVAFKRYGVFDLDIKNVVHTLDEAKAIKSNFIKYTDKTKLYNKKR